MFKALADHWFLSEPALFALYCQQQVEENVRMECGVRCGQGRLEYNPLVLQHKSFAEVEQLVRIELIRLFLKHPYEREPEGCSRQAMSIGSDITIADGYCTLHHEKLPLQEPGFYHLPMGQYYEWYAKKIQEQNQDESEGKRRPDEGQNQPDQNQGQRPANSPETENQPHPSTQQADQDKSALWREDSLQRERIDQLIERTTDWGTLPADVVERIKASTQARISNRLVWQGFRSTILNSQRQLTRMRPNRRTGFVQMGNTRQFRTRLLVAVDVSGSITTEVLADFYSAINRLFRYGMAQIDTCQFDAEMGEVVPMQRASTSVEVKGRGGTSFDPLFAYISAHHEYDGLVILTDGEAPQPQLSSPHPTGTGHSPRGRRLAPGTHILWVCSTLEAYHQNHLWMETTGRCCHL